MNADELWKKYCAENSIDINTRHDVWAFGAAPDELAKLVLKGIKTATASAYDLYFIDSESEPLPEVGGYSIILNSKDEALCIIQTTKVRIMAFKDMTYDICKLEGEDEVLETWIENHVAFLKESCDEYGYQFSFDMPIVFEEFKVVYK